MINVNKRRAHAKRINMKIQKRKCVYIRIAVHRCKVIFGLEI